MDVSIRARVEEILAAGAERAEITVEQVLRQLAVRLLRHRQGRALAARYVSNGMNATEADW